MNKCITIIIPVYKVEKYLNRCIESIVKQTYENLEIIIVDDGSPDKCPQICDEWKNKDNRIQVIHKKMEVCPQQEMQEFTQQQVSIFYLWIRMIALYLMHVKNCTLMQME